MYCTFCSQQNKNKQTIIKQKAFFLIIVKSKEINFESDKFKQNTYQYLIDGTMINLFNINDEWIISTRSEIGGYNKWKGEKSFRKMFDECINFDIN